MPTDYQKSGISHLFQGSIHALERGVLTLDEVLGIVDKVAERLPGDDRQLGFYNAIRELAKKVDAIKPGATPDVATGAEHG